MLYSVRMRAAQGGSHEAGGRHISGAERLVFSDQIAAIASAMVERALNHSRGQAEFINIQVDLVPEELVRRVPLLPVRTIVTSDFRQGRQAALACLAAAGITEAAAAAGMSQLLSLADSLRGAMLICADTGRRLDSSGPRGVRVSRMDCADPRRYRRFMQQQGLSGEHAAEAMVLAAKVMSAPGIVAELCWSDDPEYTAGYVASRKAYQRITELKPLGSAVGGRVFFVRPDADLAELEHYLQFQPVLVELPAAEDETYEVY